MQPSFLLPVLVVLLVHVGRATISPSDKKTKDSAVPASADALVFLN